MRQSLGQMFRITIVALLVACAAPAEAGAQDDSREPDDFAEVLDLGQFDGIEFAVARGWGLESMTREPVAGQLLSLTTLVLQFGSDDDASDAFQPLSDLISARYGESGIPLVESALDGDDQIGDETIRSVVDLNAPVTDQADMNLFRGLTVLSVRSNESIVVVIALPLEGDAKAMALAIAQSVIDREVGDDSVSLDSGGASTGGLFDQLPDADDPILTEAGVVPGYDFILFPTPD